MAYGPGQAYPPYHAVPDHTGPAGSDPANTWYGASVPSASVPLSGAVPVNPDWLAATADRERIVGVLRAGFAEGRLTQEELDDRVARAYASRTYRDLWSLTADLPSGPLPYPQALPFPGVDPASSYQQDLAVKADAPPPSNWSSAAALIITAIVIFTLAALVTAIATAHAQPMPLQPFQHANLAPYITGAGNT